MLVEPDARVEQDDLLERQVDRLFVGGEDGNDGESDRPEHGIESRHVLSPKQGGDEDEGKPAISVVSDAKQAEKVSDILNGGTDLHGPES
jgi:hypothetical protein